MAKSTAPVTAIVIPTINGRGEHLARCLEAYARTAPRASIYVKHDHPSCGEAWIAGAKEATRDGFDYLHLTADDIEPHDGWLEAAIETVDAGFIPAPLVYDSGGSLDSAGLQNFGQYRGEHADWQLIEGTTIPFLSRAMWERIGMLPIHYCSDLYVSVIGRRHGWETAIRTPMRFTHHVAPEGRDYSRAGRDTEEFMRCVTEPCAS